MWIYIMRSIALDFNQRCNQLGAPIDQNFARTPMEKVRPGSYLVNVALENWK